MPLLNNEPDDTLRTGMLGLFFEQLFSLILILVQDLCRSLEPVSNTIHTIEMDEPASENTHAESYSTRQNVGTDMAMDIDNPPLHATSDPPGHNLFASSLSIAAGGNITHQPRQQSTLQLSGTLAVTPNVIAQTSTKQGDHCAVCVNAHCRHQ